MTDVGLALLVIGVIVGIAEAHVPTHGIIGGAGVLIMAIGAVLAISGLGAGVAVGLAGGVVLAGAGATALVLALRPGLQAQGRRVRTGAQGLVGRPGTVRAWSGSEGSVALDGSVWTARRCLMPAEEPEADLHEGDRVVVVSLTGLTVSVRRAEEWELI